MNSLGSKLTSIKRELTALKTAHKRGLGNVIVYSIRKNDIPQPAYGSSLTITINFDQNYATYPFFEFRPYFDSIGTSGYFFGIPSVKYTNSGYSAVVVLPYDLANITYPSAYILSMSPVVSVEYS